MRLYELESSNPNEIESTLVSLLHYLKGKGSQTPAGIRIPIKSVNALMKNLGYGITYDEINLMQQKNPAIKNLIKSVSQDELIINTGHEADNDLTDQGEFIPGDEQTVQQMAKSAVNRRE